METNNKMREALKDIGRLVEQIHFLYSDYPSEIHEIARKVNAALAEPVKNSEVGTAEEQGERFSAYCRTHKHPESECLLCPLLGQTGGYCELAWAQTPYEGDAK